MFWYVTRRIFQSVFVMLIVSAVAFSLFNFVGDPVNQMVGQDATREQRQAITEELGLNDPIIVQYTRFVGRAIQGEFGISLRSRISVSELIADRLPATLELVFVSAILSLVFGILAGIYTGIHRNSWFSRTILSGSLIGVSLPTFIIGIALIYLFAVQLALASLLRSLRYCASFWYVGDVAHYHRGLALDHPARADAFALSGDDHSEAGPRGDVGGHADRLYPLCPRAWVARPRHSFQPCAQEHAGACHHDHRDQYRRAHCLFESLQRLFFSGRARGFCSFRRLSLPTCRSWRHIFALWRWCL